MFGACCTMSETRRVLFFFICLLVFLIKNKAAQVISSISISIGTDAKTEGKNKACLKLRLFKHYCLFHWLFE